MSDLLLPVCDRMHDARCDREDRHRGLCNHRATIPGPAACPEPETQQEDDEEEEEDEGQDASNMDDGECFIWACQLSTLAHGGRAAAACARLSRRHTHTHLQPALCLLPDEPLQQGGALWPSHSLTVCATLAALAFASSCR